MNRLLWQCHFYGSIEHFLQSHVGMHGIQIWHSVVSTVLVSTHAAFCCDLPALGLC